MMLSDRLRNISRMNPRNLVIGLLAALVMGVVLGESPRTPKSVLISLPGSQVGTVAAAEAVQICRGCHYSADTAHPVAIARDWSGSMMAHAARDPIFYSALAVANKYRAGTGEYCIRCHTPMGWLAGHSEDFTGQAIAGTDFDGVQCDYCHRLVDPLNPDSTVIPPLSRAVPGYGNGMHVIETYGVYKRGPFEDAHPPHPFKYDPFQKTSELCGVCHDVSNPEYARDPQSEPPYEYAPLERTYSEWLMSWYATQGDSGTCQSCHMKLTPGFVCTSQPLRTNVARHDLTGGNTFVPDILPDFFPGLDTSAIAEGKQRTIGMLQSAADLSLSAYHSGDSVLAQVRITNLTGHKLPTGYPDGRRMWINIVALDAGGDTVFQSGAYDGDSASLLHDSQLKVYEAIQGLTNSAAKSFGLAPGPTLHFALNDTVYFDNRIPPKGYNLFGFSTRRAEPVGVSYEDDQYWDDTRYLLPNTASTVTATLYYQTISREYIDFLRSENQGNAYDWNDWGGKLQTAWQTHGKSTPVAMNLRTMPVKDSADAVRENQTTPFAFKLMQNYPNPLDRKS